MRLAERVKNVTYHFACAAYGEWTFPKRVG
jgi:hypothetical protein